MAQYRIHDPNEMVQCPYNETHMVAAKILQNHLRRCRKNHSGPAFGRCPFNATHELPKAEMRHHMSVCPDRIVIQQDIDHAARKASGEDTRLKGCTATPVYSDFDVSSSEDWDSELEPRVFVVSKQEPSPNGRAVFKDWSRSSLNGKAGASLYQDGQKDLRLPMSSSMAAMEPKLRDQPVSGLFTSSIGRGGGRGRAKPTQVGAPEVFSPGYGRGSETFTSGYGRGSEAFTPGYGLGPEAFTPGFGRGSALGIGRGLAPGLGRGNVAPPPGFCVPNINEVKHN